MDFLRNIICLHITHSLRFRLKFINAVIVNSEKFHSYAGGHHIWLILALVMPVLAMGYHGPLSLFPEGLDLLVSGPQALTYP